MYRTRGLDVVVSTTQVHGYNEEPRYHKLCELLPEYAMLVDR